MKDLKEQHLEAIGKSTWHMYSHEKEAAAEKCAEISEHHGEIQYLEGVLIGLKICKEMWAQGTISHEEILENEIHYKEELKELKNEKETSENNTPN